MERKVYSDWAFKGDEREKQRINREIYEELKSKYKIASSTKTYDHETKQMRDVNLDDYDIVFSGASGYGHCLYTIHKNAPNLSIPELALLCDAGDLCFGYTMQGSKIRVFTD